MDRQYGASVVTWRTICMISEACSAGKRPLLVLYSLVLLAFHSAEGQQLALDALGVIRGSKVDRNIFYVIDGQVASLVPWIGKSNARSA